MSNSGGTGPGKECSMHTEHRDGGSQDTDDDRVSSSSSGAGGGKGREMTAINVI